MQPFQQFFELYILFLLTGAAAEIRVMLSVITRNRFWTHALSTLSLLQSLQHARKHEPQIFFEWQILDDASDKTDAKNKHAMISDLLDRGWVSNYTKLVRRVGTVQLKRHAVDTFVMREDLDLFLHCDDDVLVGKGTLARAVKDYVDLRRGGVLALFVNSWLDEQLSFSSPAFGPYATAPFLGGAAYVADRATLAKNPWAAAKRTASPHEAHVQWLRGLLPAQGRSIWVRWQQPYECQHLGNVQTLNFGTQPEWEPMWAIHHETKRIVEVPGYSSVEVRAALWRNCLRDFVVYRNSLATEKLKLKGPVVEDWLRKCRRTHFNYLEIGTSDFDTLLSRHVWREEVRGISVEPVRAYFERLPSAGGKLLLNLAVSDHDGYDTIYLVPPELVAGYMGSESLCDEEQVKKLGLSGCLPGWIRGTSSLRPPEGVRQLLGEELKRILAKVQVPSITYRSLVTIYGVGSLDILKLDTEGFDHQILQQVLALGRSQGLWPGQVQFEKNMLSDWQALDNQAAWLMNGLKLLWRNYRTLGTDAECRSAEALDDALELRTMRRQADGSSFWPAKERPPEIRSDLDEELAVLEATYSHASVRTLATETVLDSIPGSKDGSAAWESASREVILSALGLPSAEGEAVLDVRQEVTPAASRSSCAPEGEVRPIPQESLHSSPANSAVTSVGAGHNGYQVHAVGVPGAVLSAEDEAVTGLRRRGGVEVVIEPSVPARPPSSDPMASRPPRPAGAAPDEALPGLGPKPRRPSAARKETPRRSLSLGRRMQSNRKLVRNALEKTCLKGDANREQREQVLRSFDEDLEKCERFIILFRSIHTGRHDLRALYGFFEGAWSRVLQVLPSPASLEQRMVAQCLRYDSGGKEFKEVPASQETLSVADAVFLHPQYLQKSRVVVP
ncbi:unnamed protein product [Effrenium voratum]|nr:unnamed protein product [Effrenium voratum]